MHTTLAHTIPALTRYILFHFADRKIRCDRGFPACSNCTRTNRTCQGYGVRLSWPRDRDRRRFVIGPMPPRREHVCRSKNAHAIHVKAWDMEVYRYLTETKMFGKSETLLPSYTALSAMPSTMMTSEIELLHFCALRPPRIMLLQNLILTNHANGGSRIMRFQLPYHVR